MPVYLGYHIENLTEPFWCAVDFTIPSILVPNGQCKNCDGKAYSSARRTYDLEDRFVYSHNMMYWRFTNGSFSVQEEQDMMMLGYQSGKMMHE